MKQTVMSILALIGAIALAGGAFFLWSNLPGRTAVSVNGRILTARELDWRAQTLIDDAKRMENLLIPEHAMKEAMRHYRRTAAKMWIVKEVLLAAAVESGVKATADDEKASLARVASQLKSRNLTPEQFFKEGPIPENIKREDFREALLIGKLTKRDIDGKISLTTKEIDDRMKELREFNALAAQSGKKTKVKANRKAAIDMLRREKYNEGFRNLFRAKFSTVKVKCPAFPDLEAVDGVSPPKK
jgi:uncharacterized protein YnzC (UPF0291/DUF896 family)